MEIPNNSIEELLTVIREQLLILLYFEGDSCSNAVFVQLNLELTG